MNARKQRLIIFAGFLLIAWLGVAEEPSSPVCETMRQSSARQPGIQGKEPQLITPWEQSQTDRSRINRCIEPVLADTEPGLPKPSPMKSMTTMRPVLRKAVVAETETGLSEKDSELSRRIGSRGRERQMNQSIIKLDILNKRRKLTRSDMEADMNHNLRKKNHPAINFSEGRSLQSVLRVEKLNHASGE